MIELGEIVSVIKGDKASHIYYHPVPGSRPYLQIEDLRPGATAKYACIENGVYATKDDVIIAWDGANAGTVGFNLQGYVGSTLAILRPKSENVFAPFLGYFLMGKFQEIQRNCTGATIPHVNRDHLLSLKLPLPPLSEQQRIATILEKADRLRGLRRYALETAETFLQSVFMEMFGDPIKNPKGWEIRKLKSVSCKFSDGPFGSNLKTEHYVEKGVRVIRLQNIGVGRLIDDDKVFISQTHFNKLFKHCCLPDDVIVGTLGDPNLRAFVLPHSIPFALNKADCVQIRPDPNKANPHFLCWLLNIPQTLHLAYSMLHGQTRTRISMGQLAQLEVPIPPIDEQEKFVPVVKKFEQLREGQIEALRQTEHLFQTLLHRVFNGQL